MRFRGSIWGVLALMVSVLGFGMVAIAQAPAYATKADMVRGAQGAMGPVCVPNSVFYNGEMIVFRLIVNDGVTGEEMKFDQVNERGITAKVVIDDFGSFDMFYAPPDTSGGEDGPPPGFDFFRGPVPIPADAPPGQYTWHVEVADSAGNAATFQPIVGNVITLMAPN